MAQIAQLLNAMPDIITIAPTMQRLVSAAFPALLRGFYSEAKLNECLRIEVPSSGEGLTYNTHTLELRCHLAVTNLTPFQVIIDRLEVEASLDGGTLGCVHVMPTTIKSGERYLLLVRGRSYMPPSAIEYAKANAKHLNLGVSAFVVTNVRRFTTTRRMDYVKNFALQ
ncbi:MAG: hypothetical protein IAE82_02370 [Opitutaceae bacterium]|nr:hypothetical protein [Opitutaceae bacterium]